MRPSFLSFLLAVTVFPLLALLPPVVPRTAAADAASPAAELAAFSVFPNVDPGQLLKAGDVKTARGPAMSSARGLSAQSCYVVPGPPAKALEALRQWDPSRHRELKIFLHADLSGGAPGPAGFSRLRSTPDNGSVRKLVDLTQKLSPELQISREEAKRFSPGGGGGGGAMPEPVASFWAGVLAGRAGEFASGGAARQSAYDHTGQNVRPGEELSDLLRQQDKIRRQFASFLGESGVTGGRASLRTENYYELIDVDDEGVLTLGSFASKPTAGGGFQAADVLYYASGGYYVALTLYQMWPVDVGGQPATLVWRGDLISAASLGSLRGVEKLASESAMMKDVSRAVTLLKRDTAAAGR